MKKLVFLVFASISANAHAQVIIGDDKGTVVDKTSVLLEFAKNNDVNKNCKGLILPYVQVLPSSGDATEGTILLHADENGAKSRMKYYNGSDWIDLSGRDANISSSLAIQNGKAEKPDAKVIIGSTETAANGALVLESTTKAMVLPIVEDVINIPSPSPGMMVYVKKDGAKRLAVFNGNVWSFWRS